jgi:hypothetical protein
VSRAIQQIVDLFIGCLTEVFVPQSNREEGLRRDRAIHLISFTSQHRAGFSRRYRHGYDNPPWFFLAQRDHGDTHAGSGCKAIVYKYDGAASYIGKRAVTPILPLATLELGLLGSDDLSEIFFGDTELPNEPLIDYAHPTARDRAHCKLFVKRQPELADDEHIQRRSKSLRHLECDRYSTAG